MLPRRSRRLRLRAIPRRNPWGPMKAIGAVAMLLLGLFWVTRHHASGVQCPSYCHTQSSPGPSHVFTLPTNDCIARNGVRVPAREDAALVAHCKANPQYNVPATTTPYVPPPTYTPAPSPQEVRRVAPSAACQQALAGGRAAVAGHPLGQHIYDLCAANPAYTFTHEDLVVAHCMWRNHAEDALTAAGAWWDTTTATPQSLQQDSMLRACRANPAFQAPPTEYCLTVGQPCTTTPPPACHVVTGQVTLGRVNPTVGLPLSTGVLRWVPAIVDSGAPVSWVRTEVMGGVTARSLGVLGSVLFPFFHNEGGTYKEQVVVVNLYLRGNSGTPLPVGPIHLEELYGAPANIANVGLGLDTLHRVAMSTSGGRWTLTPPCA